MQEKAAEALGLVLGSFLSPAKAAPQAWPPLAPAGSCLLDASPLWALISPGKETEGLAVPEASVAPEGATMHP